MTETFKKVGQITLTGAGTKDSLYTVPEETETAIKHIRLVNYSGAGTTVKLWHDGENNNNLILPMVTLGAGEWAEFDGSILMEADEVLKAEAGAGSSITVTVYGVEFS